MYGSVFACLFILEDGEAWSIILGRKPVYKLPYDFTYDATTYNQAHPLRMVVARRKTVVRVQRGGLIGDIAIMHDCPSPTTVTAGTARILVWALDASAFHAMVQAFLEVRRAMLLYY